MGKVLLFAILNADIVPAWLPSEEDIRRYGRALTVELQDVREITRSIDNRTREKVAVLSSVLGLTCLANLCTECALTEIVALCERPDVYAVLDAHHKRQPTTGATSERRGV